MLDHQLFLGFPLSADYQHALDPLPSSLKKMFIQMTPSPYLQQIEYERISYLGKFLGPCFELSSLNEMESHIYSLLKRLLPAYPYQEGALVFVPIPFP